MEMQMFNSKNYTKSILFFTMWGSYRCLFVIVSFLVSAFLLSLFYIDINLLQKTSSSILRFSGNLRCENKLQTFDFPKATIGPFYNENPPSCSCRGDVPANVNVPKEELEDVQKRRAEEYRQHQIRAGKHNDVLVLAPPNTPLQYPIKGFKVEPLIATLIPGLAVQTQNRDLYKVSLSAKKGVLSVTDAPDNEGIIGRNERFLTILSNSLEELNYLLSRVTYASTVYHIKTEDLIYFSFEDHEVIFPVEIRRQQIPALYDPGKDVNSKVTVLVKAFLRYKELRVLIESIRVNYPKIKIIIADDSHNPEKIVGDNIEQYFMPPAQGWFAGRNLAVSQVTTKYFLWVDDDFVFLNQTSLERFVEVMETLPEIDVVGGQVQKNSFAFKLQYKEGDDDEGGCLTRTKTTHAPVPEIEGCFYADGVVNYFMARTDAVRRVGFDPFLKRVAHSEFFMDGLGQLLVVTCNNLPIGHQKRSSTSNYSQFRHPASTDAKNKLTHQYFKNHLKCIAW